MSGTRKRHGRLIRSVVVGVVLAVPGVVIATQLTGLARGNQLWSGRDYVGATTAYGVALQVNVAEPWVAWFNRGVAHYGQRSWQQATDDFTRAAELAPDDKQCMVRLNLAWSLEAMGDELAWTGDDAGARIYWEMARDPLVEAECRDDQPDDSDSNNNSNKSEDGKQGQEGDGQPQPGQPEGDEGPEGHVAQPGDSQAAQQHATETRLESKTGQVQPQPGRDPNGGDVPDADEQLQQREEQSQAQRQAHDGTDEVPTDQPGSTGRNW